MNGFFLCPRLFRKDGRGSLSRGIPISGIALSVYTPFAIGPRILVLLAP